MESSKMNNRRRNYYRSNDKPQWEIDRENAERERQAEIARKLENTEENFPALSGLTTRPPPVWGGRKFNELATDWKREDDERKEQEEREKQGDTKNDGDFFPLPRFNPTHYYVEQEEEQEAPKEAPAQTAEQDDESGWAVVDSRAKRVARKARKEKRIEERLRRLDDGEELTDDDDENEQEQDETCWGEPAAHETYWEGRHP